MCALLLSGWRALHTNVHDLSCAAQHGPAENATCSHQPLAHVSFPWHHLTTAAPIAALPGRVCSRFGTPWIAVLLNAALIASATVILEFGALLQVSREQSTPCTACPLHMLSSLHPFNSSAPPYPLSLPPCLSTPPLRSPPLQLSMFFYAINVIMQCLALLRLRISHPHRLRPARVAPIPVVCLPMGISIGVLLLSPPSHWMAALGEPYQLSSPYPFSILPSPPFPPRPFPLTLPSLPSCSSPPIASLFVSAPFHYLPFRHPSQHAHLFILCKNKRPLT